MQSMDEQPVWPPKNQQPIHHHYRQENQEEQPTEHTQEPPVEQSMGETEEKQTPLQTSIHNSPATSERIPFAYPSTPTSYPPTPQDYPPRMANQPVAGPSNPWGYPQQPGPYQSTGFGQPEGAPAGSLNANALGQASSQSATSQTPRQSKLSSLRTGVLLTLLALLLVVFGTGLFAGWQFGRMGNTFGSPSSFQPGNNASVNIPPLTGTNIDIVREGVINKVQPGVVQIDVISASQHALGSGVIIDGRGYIITNNHVVSNATSIQVTLADGSTFVARTIGTDPADDLAVIKITPPSTGLSVVNIANSSQLRVGQEVLAIGSPLGNAETVTSGIVSALSRTISEGQNGPTIPDAIQTDAPINPGNSGGALVDLQGNLVGIPTLNAIDTEFNTPANGLGFAIPANRVKFIAQQLIETGHVTHTGRAIVGISVITVDQNVAARNHLNITSGVLVESVTTGGPAAAAHMNIGDVIVQAGNTVIHNTSDLNRILIQHAPGDTFALKVVRNGQQITINVILGELPAS